MTRTDTKLDLATKHTYNADPMPTSETSKVLSAGTEEPSEMIKKIAQFKQGTTNVATRATAIDDLPSEVFAGILDSLKWNDVKNMMKVSPLWEKRVLGDPRTPILKQVTWITIRQDEDLAEVRRAYPKRYKWVYSGDGKLLSTTK